MGLAHSAMKWLSSSKLVLLHALCIYYLWAFYTDFTVQVFIDHLDHSDERTTNAGTGYFDLVLTVVLLVMTYGFYMIILLLVDEMELLFQEAGGALPVLRLEVPIRRYIEEVQAGIAILQEQR